MRIKAMIFGGTALPIAEGQKNDWGWFVDRKIALYALKECNLPTDTPVQEVENYEALERMLKEKAVPPHQVLFIYGSEEDLFLARQKHFYTLPTYDLDRIARAINLIEYS